MFATLAITKIINGLTGIRPVSHEQEPQLANVGSGDIGSDDRALAPIPENARELIENGLTNEKHRLIADLCKNLPDGLPEEVSARVELLTVAVQNKDPLFKVLVMREISLGARVTDAVPLILETWASGSRSHLVRATLIDAAVSLLRETVRHLEERFKLLRQLGTHGYDEIQLIYPEHLSWSVNDYYLLRGLLQKIIACELYPNRLTANAACALEELVIPDLEG